MSEARIVIPETRALLEFRGPDAERFLNGQLTQDVRRVAGGSASLPACVTDAKGRLQFRVRITEGADGTLWVEGEAGASEALKARLTRYLIADDVEVMDITGKFRLLHWIGPCGKAPEGVVVRETDRFGVPGTDWWLPADVEPDFSGEAKLLDGSELEAFRIANGVPLWGRELNEGILPPEAGLDATDVSYQKGCYIGQEVISRIKSAGKVNKRLVRLRFDAALDVDSLTLVDSADASAGELTSVSPLAEGARRAALGYVKRGVDAVFVSGADRVRHPVEVL